jgi:hypothetical protein
MVDADERGRQCGSETVDMGANLGRGPENTGQTHDLDDCDNTAARDSCTEKSSGVRLES